LFSATFSDELQKKLEIGIYHLVSNMLLLYLAKIGCSTA